MDSFRGLHKAGTPGSIEPLFWLSGFVLFVLYLLLSIVASDFFPKWLSDGFGEMGGFSKTVFFHGRLAFAISLIVSGVNFHAWSCFGLYFVSNLEGKKGQKALLYRFIFFKSVFMLTFFYLIFTFNQAEMMVFAFGFIAYLLGGILLLLLASLLYTSTQGIVVEGQGRIECRN